MYSLISDGKVIGTADDFKAACELAKTESLVDKGMSRTVKGVRVTGRIVSVWSGPIGPYVEGSKAVRGVTRHASFACGSSW